jgi:CHASE3 domain sensor protein
MGTFTLETGLGMLLMGLIMMAIAGTIMYLTINAIEDHKIKKQKEKEARERIHGLD